MTATICARCAGEQPRPNCANAFAHIGIVKVHWECWSLCNLGCEFCYRTLGNPLNTADGEVLLGAIAASGARTIVFAGGDPGLRRDLPHLIGCAKSLGLAVEVQTNAHHIAADLRELLLSDTVDLVGLSLDGATSATHDMLRVTRGNFRRVLNTLAALDAAGRPVIVRTMVNAENINELDAIGALVAPHSNVIRWSLLEFTPVGEGFRNAQRFEISHHRYVEAAESARSYFARPDTVDVYTGERKTGTYALITPEGGLYGTGTVESGTYPVVGNMLTDHLDDLAAELPFDLDRHRARYGGGLAGLIPLEPKGE